MTPDREAELREDYTVCAREKWTARRFLIEALDGCATLRTDRDASREQSAALIEFANAMLDYARITSPEFHEKMVVVFREAKAFQ